MKLAHDSQEYFVIHLLFMYSNIPFHIATERFRHTPERIYYEIIADA